MNSAGVSSAGIFVTCRLCVQLDGAKRPPSAREPVNSTYAWSFVPRLPLAAKLCRSDSPASEIAFVLRGVAVDLRRGARCHKGNPVTSHVCAGLRVSCLCEQQVRELRVSS